MGAYPAVECQRSGPLGDLGQNILGDVGHREMWAKSMSGEVGQMAFLDLYGMLSV